MRVRYFMLCCVSFLISIMPSEILHSQEIPIEAMQMWESKAAEIRSSNPRVSQYILGKDIDFLKKNIQKTNLAKLNLPYRALFVVTADAWADIRVKNIIEPTVPLNSLVPLDKYGVLWVNSKPQGATVILNKKEIWDKVTNTYKGVISGTHLVEVELKGYWADPKQVIIPEGGNASVEFDLKKK